MKRIFFTTILLLVFCFSVYSQTDNYACPANFALFPQGIVSIENPVKIAVNSVENADKSNLKYEWTISAGKIVKGQGTSEIEVIANQEEAGLNITVVVKIIGLQNECSISEIFGSEQPMACGLAVDNFGKLEPNDFKLRLDVFLAEVITNKDDKGLIIVEFYKSDSVKNKKAYLKLIKNHIKFRKAEISRFLIAIAENEIEQQTTFYRVPPKAELPISYKEYILVEGIDLEQKINELFPKK